MYPTKATSLFYIAIALLLITMTQIVSAAPADPNLASVVADNRKTFCYGRACYIKNDTVTTDSVVQPSTSTPLSPSAVAASDALTLRQPAVVLPAMIAGTSLLMLL